MGACTYGASVKPGEPTWYYVTDEDLDRWFGTWNVTRLAFQIYNGRAYNLAELAAANPDTPPVRGWSDLITAMLGGGTYGGVNGLTGYGADLVGYLVFLEHCQCNGAPGTLEEKLLTAWATDLFNQYSGWFGTRFKHTDNVNARTLSGIRWFPPPALGYTNTHFKLCDGSGATLVDYGTLVGTAVGGSWYRFNPPVPTPLAYNTEYVLMGYSARVGENIARILPPVTTPSDLTWLGGAQRRDDNPVWNTSTAFSYAADAYIAGGAAPSTTPPAAPPVSMTGAQALPVPAGTTNDQLAQAILRLQIATDTYGAVIQLLQERLSPLAYAAGATHAVSGTGQIAVANLLGIAVSFTTVPARLPVESGTPDNIWQLGRISFGTPEGWQRNITLTHDPDLLLPVSAFITKIGYTFPVGVAAIITELKAAS